MTNAKPSFLRKAKGYKKHGAIAVLFVFVEMICLSAYRGRFYGGEWYLRQICLVILILPLARLMKDRFFVILILPLALLSEESQKTQDTGYPVEGVQSVFSANKIHSFG